uniref:Uncharacterized protein n=1 Tax=Arundo donax TaxID=35708 RepID=A0A0A9D022_ARUDO
MTRFDLGKDLVLVQAGLQPFHRLVLQRNHKLQCPSWTDRVLVVVSNHTQS